MRPAYRIQHCSPFLALTLLSTLAACGSRLRCFTSVSGFTKAELTNQPVLLVPIAVTDELGDDRTGIVIDRDSRHQAAKLACSAATAIRDDVRIVCFDDPAAIASSDLPEVNKRFARDVAIPLDRWHGLARTTGARFALLFRPEEVNASRSVTKVRQLHDEIAPYSVMPKEFVTTSRTYTLRCDLVDLHSGQVVRAAMRSGGDSTSTPDPPEARTHLYDLMHALMKDVLE
jgi:hypothetical protein